MRILHQFATMKERGFEITVLTARWQPAWPEFAVCRNIPVHRLLPPPASNWNENHFQKNVAAWISQSIDQYDLIYVDRADGLLMALAAKSSRWKKPVVGRFAPDDPLMGVPHLQMLSASAAADACRRCSFVVTPTLSAARTLVSHGVASGRIQCIPDVAWESYDRNQDLRRAAATALFEANCDLVIPTRTEVLLHYGRTSFQALRPVIEGTCELLDEGASMRLWIVGCGTQPDAIYQLVRDRGWHREILLFDTFDDLQELIAVADLAVVSNPVESLQYSLPHWVEAGLPCLVADTRESREYMPSEFHARLFSSSGSFASQLREWQLYPSDWRQEALELKRWRRSHATSESSIHDWQTMIHNLSSEMSA